MCEQRKSQNEQTESEAGAEGDGKKRMHSFFLQGCCLAGLERHFPRQLLIDGANHPTTASNLQAVVQIQMCG